MPREQGLLNIVKIRWYGEIRAAISALVFAAVVSAIFRSWELAWLITLSLVIHELGHILMVASLGIEWKLGFSALGAWTQTPIKSRRALKHYSNSLIHLAGPYFSLLLAFFALISDFFIRPGLYPYFWQSLANFNALLCLLNLLPMANLSDGGKFVRKLFSSADETLEQRLLAMVGILPLSVISTMLVFRLDWARLLSLLTIVLWFVLTMILESKLDDPEGHTSEKSMSPRQARELLAGMILMLLISMGIIVFTPFWLTPEHVVKMVIFFSTLLS